MPTYAAVDLGAESGRVVRGELDGGRLVVEEVARFSNRPVLRHGHLRWDLPRLIQGAVDGLARAGDVASVGVDAWGVDFGLLDADERLLEWPVTYRDPRTDGVLERFHERVPAADVYRTTGIQFLSFNTLYQLAALAEASDPVLDDARHLLMIPDLLLHELSGALTTEWTNATTTQLLDARTRAWAPVLLQAAGTPADLLPAIVEPGTRLGSLRPAIRERTGLAKAEVVAPATHDTASAVAAVPLDGPASAYVSSGTWSLVGVETEAPVITPEAWRLGFTNEGGVGGTNRLLRNVTGLWLVQRCRADLGGEATYDDVARLAEAAEPLRSIVDVDDPRFLDPPSMPDALASYCVETGQPEPQTPGALYRAAFESLALAYRRVLADLERLTGRSLDRVHVVGGGSQNELLCRMTAAATGREVLAGPVEATAIGNLLVQAMALGHLDSLLDLREVVRRSFPLVRYEPHGEAPWSEAARRLETFRERLRA